MHAGRLSPIFVRPGISSRRLREALPDPTGAVGRRASVSLPVLRSSSVVHSQTQPGGDPRVPAPLVHGALVRRYRTGGQENDHDCYA